MRTIYSMMIAILLVMNSSAQTARETLTNESIITLTKIGLQSSVIVTKIKSSDANFDVSTDALINLSKNGVASDVINEMMKAKEIQDQAAASVMDSKNPNDMHKSGVYYYYAGDNESPLNKLDAVRVSYRTSSGGWGGYGGSSTTANLNGEECRNTILEKSPVFYFYFEAKGQGDDWYQSTSPSEFDLVKCKVDDGKRFFRVGGSSSGMFSSGASSGIQDEIKVQFDYDEVSEGIYKVTFKNPLAVGAYCFVFSGNTYKVFDFCIE